MPPQKKDLGWRVIVDIDRLMKIGNMTITELHYKSEITAGTLNDIRKNPRKFVTADVVGRLLTAAGMDPTDPLDVAKVVTYVKIDPDD